MASRLVVQARDSVRDPQILHTINSAVLYSPALPSHVKRDYRACEEAIAIQGQGKAPGTVEGKRNGAPQDRRAQIAPEPPRTDILAVRAVVGDG